jgi:glutaredoxin-like protein NrdH
VITVYSQPHCAGCTRTKNYLKNREIDFVEVNILEDEAAQQKLMKWGYRVVPVVEAGDEHWAGHKPDLLAALAAN